MWHKPSLVNSLSVPVTCELYRPRAKMQSPHSPKVQEYETCTILSISNKSVSFTGTVRYTLVVSPELFRLENESETRKVERVQQSRYLCTHRRPMLVVNVTASSGFFLTGNLLWLTPEKQLHIHTTLCRRCVYVHLTTINHNLVISGSLEGNVLNYFTPHLFKTTNG